MPDVKVGLRTVIGDEHLTVLERIHRARIDIEVGVELLHDNSKPARRQKVAKAGGGEALTQRGGNAPRDENVPGRPC
ncbi:hypothetical protein Pa4123_80880 [Phytohabitans aurantiacus]|uniref:Uncharacterized protein n=1 Tax=Phytohabitans aurantiacus TaxID=3016789 RepID=A0ABQ5RA05_9ACTN|nr:hypothetical protein Pa4123_80880 [Phytohabitans aurantiacus]